MRIGDTARLSIQNLARTRFRTFLTVSGVVIGISAIVLFVSLGVGLQKITASQIASMDSLTTITVTQTQATSTMEEGLPINDKFISEISRISEVDKISPSITVPTSITANGSSTAAIVYGIKKEYSGLEISSLSNGKYFENSKEAVISKSLATSLSGEPEKLIGQEASINIIDQADLETEKTMKVKIVGIDENDTTGSMYVDLGELVKVGQYNEYSAVKVKVKNRSQIDTVRDQIKTMGFQVATIKDLIDQIDKFFLIVQVILGIVSGIGLLVSSLGIINTMTISLLERTREIGIMKAIGAKSCDIRRLFYTESAFIGLFGGIMGVGLAYGLGSFFNFVLNVLVSESGQHLDLFVTPLYFSVSMVIFSIVISILAGIYPARRAQKLPLIVALYQ